MWVWIEFKTDTEALLDYLQFARKFDTRNSREDILTYWVLSAGGTDVRNLLAVLTDGDTHTHVKIYRAESNA